MDCIRKAIYPKISETEFTSCLTDAGLKFRGYRSMAKYGSLLLVVINTQIRFIVDNQIYLKIA